MFVAFIEFVICCALIGSLILFGFNGAELEIVLTLGFLLLFIQRELHRSIDNL